MSNKVVFGIVQGGSMETEMVDSLLSTIIRDQARNKRIIGKLLQFSGPNISASRNNIARDFLKNFPQADWLWLIDSDNTWEPDALDRLLEVADPVDAPIVGGLVFQRHVTSMDSLYRREVDTEAMIYGWHEDGQFGQVGDYPENTMLQVAATGTAFLLIHREALEKMGAEFPEPAPWFFETIHEGVLYGEDVTFCLRAGSMGLPVFVHTGVKTGHKKPHIITDADFIKPEPVVES